MNKILFTLAAIFLYQIAPLLGAPHLILHWKMLAIMATAAAIWLSQPALRGHDVDAHRSSDRNTVLIILAMAGVSTIAPEVEWAYFRNEHTGSTLWSIIGLVMMVCAVAYRIWAIHTLGKHFSSTVQTGEAQELIMSGPYRYLRHPSYLGAFVAIIGCAVLLQAWMGVLVAVAAMLYAYIQRINAEEIALEAHFGAAYRDYQMRTWRMFPGIW